MRRLTPLGMAVALALMFIIVSTFVCFFHS